jgi:hypothetical protein
MARLGQPKALEDFKGGRLFYKYYPDPADLIMWFEMVHIEKHLNRLAHLGRVTVKRGRWQRTP